MYLVGEFIVVVFVLVVGAVPGCSTTADVPVAETQRSDLLQIS